MIIESYKWRPGARVKVDPEAAGKELLRIKERKGKITTDIIVRESVPTKHIFHLHIWGASAKEAEAEYRRTRASEIMRGLFVVISRPDNGSPPIEVPAFPNMKESDANDERQCLPVEEIYSNGDLRRQLIEDVKSRLQNIRKTYGNLLELEKVWDAIDSLVSVA